MGKIEESSIGPKGPEDNKMNTQELIYSNERKVWHIAGELCMGLMVAILILSYHCDTMVTHWKHSGGCIVLSTIGI